MTTHRLLAAWKAVIIATLLVTLVGAPVTAIGQRAETVLFDNLVGDRSDPCYTRPIDGHSTAPWTMTASSFTATQAAKVTSIVMPLAVGRWVDGAVEGTVPTRIKVMIVAAKPWDGIDPGTGGSGSFWDNLPDEAAVLGRATRARVDVLWTPCGSFDIVTARFSKPIPIASGTVYWVVLQDAGRKADAFMWAASVTSTTSSTHAQHIVDANGSRWLSYLPGTYRPSAMRVLGRR